ncbi:siroheme synthase CysG [Tropicimonas sp.]|uniref:siroheme synthase CysG n=1 Tax=Tropicimonas sp. TaxID=2067044 RepID=UPI003A844D99
MDTLPIFLKIRDRDVLVDGGGTVAARRIERALSAGARVSVFDPDPGDEVLRLLAAGAGGLRHERRVPCLKDVSGCCVVWGVSGDAARDAALYQWSRQAGALCNIADRPDLCDFITPSIVDRAPVVVAISTGGAAPVIARTLRARIETMLKPSYGRLAAFAGGFRERIAATISDGRERRRFWERLIDGPVADVFLAGDSEGATALFEADLRRAADGVAPPGEVCLVGVGPGDPDLLTFRALRLMQRADVVLYDREIGSDILSLVRRDAERVFVGRGPGGHVAPQADVARIMADLAGRGSRVLRLKAGDPFVFGRGAEEVGAALAAGIPLRVVPGVTAAQGCGAYAGIPLIHADHASSCLMLGLHGRDGLSGLDWRAMVRPSQTLAVYMGLSKLEGLIAGLRDHGMPAQTPVAVIENGTRPGQRVIAGTLADIVAGARAAGAASPAMILVGGVVGLRDVLAGAARSQADTTHMMSLAPTRA